MPSNAFSSFESIRPITECTDLAGKRVLVRAGIDVPVSDDGVVLDDFRLKKTLPTLQLLRTAGARVVIIGHTSRADGTADVSLRPVCTLLNSYMPVAWAGGVVGDAITAQVDALKDGDMLMLENLRFEKGEKENDLAFAKVLASYGDIYVNDSFSVSHREHASIVGVPALLPSYAGELFMQELQHLVLAQSPKSPSLFVLGGAKFETKLPLVERLLPFYDHIFIGGALANNFFKAQGHVVGTSLVSDIDISTSSVFTSPKLLLPIDVTVGSAHGPLVKKLSEVTSEDSIRDAGPETIEMLREVMGTVETLLWNGPLGDYEHGFGASTKRFAEVVAEAKGISIVGGGDTVASIQDASITDRFTFLSTAGGAMLAFLEVGTLPGIEALKRE